MCYANPISPAGLDAVATRLAELGVAGLIVPTCRSRRATELRVRAIARGSPSSRSSRRPPATSAIERRRQSARGFVYVVSVTGVTGEREELPPELE